MALHYVIEDELHSEDHGEFPSFEAALDELKRRSLIPWDQDPNVAPCSGWRKCGRDYEIIEYQDSGESWRLLRREPVLQVSAEGVKWAETFPDGRSG
jgi:hypothetical protein